MSAEVILTCNAGSHSLKVGVYDAESMALRFRGEVERIHDRPHLQIEDADKQAVLDEALSENGYEPALHRIWAWLGEMGNCRVRAAGHRIVHGGRSFEAPVVMDDAVKQELEMLIPLAPLHQPFNLKLIDLLAKEQQDLVQVACFDTAFHRSQPDIAQQFALPYDLTEKGGILRYGFHGLSYDSIAQQLPSFLTEAQRQRVIVAHLGGGASMCALRDGRSIATTMGFTALDGLMMATRCGDLDPGVILYLLQHQQMSVEQVEALLYKQSGVLGVSGISSDMRDLDCNNDPQAQKAVELFCYTAARQLGGLLMALGGLDALIFTGAMGCGDALIRAKICDYLAWLGLTLDETHNMQHHSIISCNDSAVMALVLPTDEEYVIAQQTKQCLSEAGR